MFLMPCHGVNVKYTFWALTIFVWQFVKKSMMLQGRWSIAEFEYNHHVVGLLEYPKNDSQSRKTLLNYK